MTQISAVRAVARISHEQFAHFGNQLKKPAGKIVYVSNTPRSGTTLFMTMVQVSEKVISLSEPDIFAHLAIMKDERTLEGRLLERLVSASLRHLCRGLQSDEICVIKPQATGGRICPEIAITMPEVIHTENVCIFTKN